MTIDGAQQQTAIAEFWSWWADGGAAQAEAAVQAGDPQQLADELTSRVRAVDARLAWELSPGSMALNRLVVNAGGDIEARASARRWLRGAPDADSSWEYADSRPRTVVEGAVLEVGESRIGLDQMVVAAQRVGNHVDVTVFHPAFAEFAKDVRTLTAVLGLICALGEHDVEAWLGEISAVQSAPLDAFGLVHLPAVVDEVAQANLTPSGAPTWVLLRGEGPSGPVVAGAQVPLRVAMAPDLDRHVAVQLPFADRTEAGWPGDSSFAALGALEEDLGVALGASGRLVAHESSAGVRLLHLYVDSTGPGVELIRSRVAQWTEGEPVVVDEYDPAWQAVAHLAT